MYRLPAEKLILYHLEVYNPQLRRWCVGSIPKPKHQCLLGIEYERDKAMQEQKAGAWRVVPAYGEDEGEII